MIASILIIIFSLILFAYWFRYTCLLILSTRPARDYAGKVAEINQLNFLEVQAELNGTPRQADLDRLQKSLDRDYRLVTYLIRHSAKFQVCDDGLERIMLMVDYQIMKGWYAVARAFSNAQAQDAVREMSRIVGHFANAMGERVASEA